MPFSTTTSSPATFLTDYLAVVDRKVGKLTGEWVRDNAMHMREEMFFSHHDVWPKLTLADILPLRAMTPPDVFTSKAYGGFLSQVEGDTELTRLASIIFGDDYEVMKHFPEKNADQRKAKAQIWSMMMSAYQAHIRPADGRVMAMNLPTS